MQRAWIVGLLFVSLVGCRQKEKPVLNTYYREPHRPRFHFSPERGWMNDPNGLVYVDSTYHLFYQHYPDSNIWGPMHWGHATSKDLIYWTHQPIALYPDSLGYIFSGSAVVDEKNTSGFQTGTAKPLVAIFTYHDMVREKAGRTDRESQGIAFSNDGGTTWKKYDHNPVIKNKGDQDFRDPKVFWFLPTGRWIMPLAVGDHLEIFSSPNLKEWTFESSFGKDQGSHGGVWECPDLFPITSSDGKEKWVLIQNIGRGAVNGGSGTQYFVGNFDGHHFTNDNPPQQVLWLDYGADNYAGVTWFGAPNGRRILMGWMSNWDDYANTVPTEKWRSASTVPRDLSMVATPDGYRLRQQPVPELNTLRLNKASISSKTFDGLLALSQEGKLKDVELTFDLSQTKSDSIGLVLSNSRQEKVILSVYVKEHTLAIDRRHSGNTSFSKKFAAVHRAPLALRDQLSLRILIDVSSIEVFANDGEVVMTDIFFPTEDFTNITLFAGGGTASLARAVWYDLKPAWTKP